MASQAGNGHPAANEGAGKPKAIDLSHHLSDVAKSRLSSPLKSLAKYWGQPGVISLAGGFPCPTYFPFASIAGDTLRADSFPIVAAQPEAGVTSFGADRPNPDLSAEHIAVAKYPAQPGDANLAYALQYNLAMGIPPLKAFIKEFTEKIYQPGYSDYVTYVHAGNTDAWAITISTLCNPGEGYFTEEYTYPSAAATSVPLGVKPVGVKMDGQGMRADELRKTILEWDQSARGGMKRPHVLYTVPVGQNPCGTSLGAERKKEIYDICVEYDIIIVEDDPYYFLQQDPYVPKKDRPAQAARQGAGADQGEEAYIKSLVPTFVKLDYQGRVIRFDSFSKTIAPGSRLGWYTCNPMFAERFERQAETSTQSPCGFGQALISQLLAVQWGFAGYVRWLRGLRGQYNLRRDYMIDTLADLFDLTPVKEGDVTVLVARSKAGEKTLFEFVPPVCGMNLWIKLHLEHHPSTGGQLSKEKADGLERQIWTELAESGLLVSPGWYFAADELVGKGHFRITYSFSEAGEIRKGLEVFAKVIRATFQA